MEDDPTRASSNAEASSSGDSADAVKVGEERKDSCVPKFDQLWFCYSPGYQLQQYYIYGKVDDCSKHWTAFIDCLKKKTKYKEEVLRAEAESKHPLWDIRTHAEAQEFWQKEFGHLSGEGVQQAEDQADGAHHSGRATLV